ncbi:hypothetical protein HHK36_004687 [Tetracentron sinense]|uniref:Uncharacterized protein n=1 Tax=Tetracentron sinense TaxID=13715 RepID=A0A834ZJX7_TETSI|nr:hypothetical protein HHK36_004687 [Tetracentron sinense]
MIYGNGFLGDAFVAPSKTTMNACGFVVIYPSLHCKLLWALHEVDDRLLAGKEDLNISDNFIIAAEIFIKENEHDALEELFIRKVFQQVN